MNASWPAQLDLLFGAWDRRESPGCAVGVYSEGSVLYARGYGIAHLEHGIPITPSTVFHVASLSKQFTAAAVGLLARDGRISLDDDIRQYVTELRHAPLITFRHIIHHTSGLRDQWDMLRLSGWRHGDLKTTGDILRLAARQAHLNFQPGTRFQYINTGYTLMGIAIERITGMSLREYAEENIFKPLGMHNTFFQDDYQIIIRNRAQAYSSDGDGRLQIDVPAYETVGPTGLFSTVEDFALWERNFLFPVVGDKQFIEQMLSPFPISEDHRASYGFGLIRGHYRGLETAEHAGGDAGYRAHFLRFPGERFAVAIFCNFASMKPAQLARKVADICLDGRFPKEDSDDSEMAAWAGRAAGTPALDVQELDSLCGQYRDSLSGLTSRIERRGGTLFLVPSGGGEYELRQITSDRFLFPDPKAECLFKPAAGDEPTRMIVTYAGEETANCQRIVDEETEGDWQIEEYAGTYESSELECRYSIETANGELMLRHTKFGPCALRLLRRDQFSCSDEGLDIQFTRDEAGQITGFDLNTERVWNVRFVRL